MDGLRALTFDGFELQPVHRRLLRHGEPVVLGARAFDVLMALAERRDRVVAKTELLDLVWPGLVVEENNLQVQVSTLRKLLGPQAIATIPGRGYRFTAALDSTADGSAGANGPTAVRVAANTGAPADRLGNLPRELSPLYGRDADLQALRSLLETQGLVTVVGAGGIGKSRLAQAAAHASADRWSDGAWMVELAGLSDPALLANSVAQALGIAIDREGAALDELVIGLRHRCLLLVLDNCEHLLDATGALVQAILQGAPKVTMLATSQEPLHLPTEQQYRVMPLAVPTDISASGVQDVGAVALFVARVRAVDPRFAPGGESLAMVVDICRRLDGLPLAIELAAARVATLGLRVVCTKLDARFKLLTGGSRAALRRHQTLRAALEWSHALLSDAEKAVFRRLGVFAGGFTMELAQAVAGDAQLDEWAVLEHLSALVDKSLVVAEAGAVPRYRLLESARAFALEHLAASETAETLRRHAHALLKFLERVDGANLDCELRSDRYAALVLPELDNLRAARAWASSEAGDPQVAAAFAACSSSLIDYAVECVDWVLSMQEHFEAGEIAPALAARYWGAVAATNMNGHVLRTVQVDAAGRAASLYRAADQPRRVFTSLINLSRHLGAQTRHEAERAAHEEARSLIRPDWPLEFHYRLLLRDTSIARSAGRLDEALARGREVVDVGASSGDWRLEAIARNNLVDLLWEVGALEEARRMASELAEAFRTKPAPVSDMAILLVNLLGILSEMGRLDDALAVAREALPVMRRGRYSYVEEWLYLFWRRGQFEAAAVLLGASDAERLRYGTPHQENERRLVAAARAGLESRGDADAFASRLARGAALREGELLPLIAEALAQA
jgi:predicted ATPase/DNA-binding winged helix-turn-helix (wHTH) protein